MKKSIKNGLSLGTTSNLVFTSSFRIRVFAFDLNIAVITSLIWGATLITRAGYLLVKQSKNRPLHVILDNILVALNVIVSTYSIGRYLETNFGWQLTSNKNSYIVGGA